MTMGAALAVDVTVTLGMLYALGMAAYPSLASAWQQETAHFRFRVGRADMVVLLILRAICVSVLHVMLDVYSVVPTASLGVATLAYSIAKGALRTSWVMPWDVLVLVEAALAGVLEAFLVYRLLCASRRVYGPTTVLTPLLPNNKNDNVQGLPSGEPVVSSADKPALAAVPAIPSTTVPELPLTDVVDIDDVRRFVASFSSQVASVRDLLAVDQVLGAQRLLDDLAEGMAVRRDAVRLAEEQEARRRMGTEEDATASEESDEDVFFDVEDVDRIEVLYALQVDLDACAAELDASGLVAPTRELASRVERLVALLREPSTWAVQKEDSHLRVYYNHDADSQHHQIRAETIVAAPMRNAVAVLNEVDLFTHWMPAFRFPLRMRLSTADTLHHMTVFEQLARLEFDFPWPFQPRDAVVHIRAVDCLDEYRSFAVLVDCDVPAELEQLVPAVADGVVRMTVRAQLLVSFVSNSLSAVRIVIDVDPRIDVVPLALISFVTKTAAPIVFNKFCAVAGALRGTEHERRMEENGTFYDRIDDRLRRHV